MIGMKFWLRKWLEHHAAHLICGEHVERSAEDWHIFSEPWEQCFDTKQHESLQCKRLVQCLFSSVQQCPTSHVAELLWFTDIFVLRLYVFLGNLSFSWVVYCRMLPHAQLLIASEPFAPCCVASRGPPIWGKEAFHICPNNFRKSSKV